MKIISTILFFLLAAVVCADDLKTDPCPNDKTGYCMNQYAIKYTNQLRNTKLVSGSIAMFDNAMAHSIDQDSKGDIFHQEIGSGIRVGSGSCATTLSGENVAYYVNPSVKNAPMYCVLDLWKNSPGHFENMINPSFKSVVIAIYRKNGRVTCTQTFSREVPSGSGKCAAALPGTGAPTSQSEPETPAEPGNNAPVEQNPSTVEDVPEITGDTQMNKQEPNMEQDPVPMNEPVMNEEPAKNDPPSEEEMQNKKEKKPMMDSDMAATDKEKKPTVNSEMPTMSNGKKKNEMEGKTQMTESNSEYRLKYKSFSVTRVDGTEKKFMQKCFFGKCYYCINSSNLCLNRRATNRLERYLTHYGF